MVAPELKLTKEVASHKAGATPPLPRIVLERILRLSQEHSSCCLQTSRLAVTLEVVRVVQCWHRTEE